MACSIASTPPAGWDELVREPCQRAGFADAMATLGYRPLYAVDGRSAALILVRGWAAPLRRLTARANVFAPDADARFVASVLMALRRLGVPHVKVGDTMWGLPAGSGSITCRGARVQGTVRHTFVLDLPESDDALLKRQDTSVRTSIRRAERAGVKVREIVAPADLEAYCRLAHVTSSRVRSGSASTEFPAAFFNRLHERLTPSGAAKFYLATLDDTPLAAAVFLCSSRRMLYFAGASTRERQWTALQAPTAVLWHAVREARALGLREFDFGGCTPTEDPGDSRHGVYTFKKRWGGRLVTFDNLEVVLSRTAVFVQERVLSPAWNRFHPLYFRLLNRGSATR